MVPGQTNIFEELGVEPIKPERAKPAQPRPYRTVDGIELLPVAGYEGLVAADDGLAIRVVHTHSRKKSKKVGFYAEIVAGSMTGKWWSLWWVELHAGPAKLYEVETHELLDGSPLDALNTSKRYAGYVFVECDPVCAAALRERTRGMPNVHVIEGDERIRAYELPRRMGKGRHRGRTRRDRRVVCGAYLYISLVEPCRGDCVGAFR